MLLKIIYAYFLCFYNDNAEDKTEYCLPLGSGYLNRQSATFFIFRNYQYSTERMRYGENARGMISMGTIHDDLGITNSSSKTTVIVGGNIDYTV